MLRRIFLIVIALVVLLLGVAIILPVIYKDEIIGLIQKEANKNLRAEVQFSKDIDLSLLSNFPNLSLGLNDLSVVNQKPFAGDTLLAVDRFDVVLDVMSVIRGDQIKMLKLGVERPRLHIQVDSKGRASYDIALATDTAAATSPADTGASNFRLDLQEYYIRQADIRYEDATLPTRLHVKQFTHEGQGDFTAEQFVLTTQTSAGAVDLYFDGIHYLNEVVMDLKADLDIDLGKMRFAFKKNELSLNDLLLKFDGFVAMPQDPIEVDMTFSTVDNQFQDIFTLIPTVYKADMKGLDAQGKMSLSGAIKGQYAEKPASLPAFNIDFTAQDGRFHYADLPTTLSNVQVDLHIDNPDGVMDRTVVDMPRLHMDVNDQPFDAHFTLRNPDTDPFVKAGLRGQLDLGALAQLIPGQDLGELRGLLRSNLALEGRMSTLENEQYEQFDAQGDFQLTDFHYADDSLPQPIDIPNMELLISPKVFDLKAFDLRMGSSDLSASGQLSHFLPYYFHDRTLEGQLQVQSSFFDLNPFLEEEEAAEEAPAEPTDEAPADTSGAPRIPENIRFVMEVGMKKVQYDELSLNDIQGVMRIEDGAFIMENAGMNLLQGRMVANGQYNTADSALPFVDFGLAVNRIDPREAYKSLQMVREYLPIAENLGGNPSQTRLSTNLELTSKIDASLSPVLPSVNALGDFSAKDVIITGSKTLTRVADKLQRDDLKRVDLGDVAGAFEIRNGRFYLEPMKFQYQDTRGVLEGSNGLDQSLDYKLNLNTPAGPLQAAAQSLMDNLLGGQAASQVPNRITMVMGIGGTTTDPKITSVKLGAETTSAANSAKQQLKEELERRKREAERKAREELEKRKQQLEQKRREAERKAREEAERRRRELERKKREAERKAREEAEKRKKDAKDKAKEKLDDLF